MMKIPNRERCVFILKLNPFNLILSHFLNSRTLVILLRVDPAHVMNLKLSMKVINKLKTFLSLHGLQFSMLDSIIGYVVRFVNYLLITRQIT